jgi:hypothetical protein
VKEANGRIKYQKNADDRALNIFAERQLKDDRHLQQHRNRRQEFGQNQAQRMNGDIRGDIGAKPPKPALCLCARKSRDQSFHRSSGQEANHFGRSGLP